MTCGRRSNSPPQKVHCHALRRPPFSFLTCLSHIAYLLVLLVLPGAEPVGAATPAAVPFRLCILDQMALLQKSRIALNQAARFQQLRQQAQAKINDDRRTLDADDRALDALRSSIPPAAAAARKQELDRRRQDLLARTEQLNRNLGQLDIEITNIVMKAATPFIKAVQIDHGCSLLGSKAAFLAVNDASLDITDDLIARMNAAVPAQPQGR